MKYVLYMLAIVSAILGFLIAIGPLELYGYIPVIAMRPVAMLHPAMYAQRDLVIAPLFILASLVLRRLGSAAAKD